jgi:hypothetical protein
LARSLNLLRSLRLVGAALFLSVSSLAAPAKPIPVQQIIAEASSLVSSQQDKPANETRDLDRRLDALGAEAAKSGYKAVPALAQGVFDSRNPLKLRIWLLAYLQAVHDPAAFPPLRRLLLDSAQPDLLREAAARALAACPVAASARSRALCAALGADPGPELRLQALFEASALGCEQPAVLEVWAGAGGGRPSGRAAAEAGHALDALEHSRSLEALESLDRLSRRYARGTPQRGRVIRALAARARDLKPDLTRWSDRARALLSEEARAPENALAALALVTALDDPASAELAARFLGDDDPRVVVAAAETLAALHARERRPAIAAVLEKFYTDARFAAGPGRDPLGWYERLTATLKALQ